MVDCTYCKANGHAGYYTHDARACPMLASLSPCVYCHASGYDNHTPSHCPKKPRQMLQHRPCL